MEEKDLSKLQNVYFSGQGSVSLRRPSDEKLYDLGNVTQCTFYGNGEFTFIWESIKASNIDLLLGEYVGEEERDGRKFRKFKIHRNLSRKFELEFNGVNRADSNTQVIAKTTITISEFQQVSLIEDKLTEFKMIGTWDSDIEFFYDAEEWKAPPKTWSLQPVGNLIGIYDEEDKLQSLFNPSQISSVIPNPFVTSDFSKTCDIRIGVDIYLKQIKMSVETFALQLKRIMKVDNSALDVHVTLQTPLAEYLVQESSAGVLKTLSQNRKEIHKLLK